MSDEASAAATSAAALTEQLCAVSSASGDANGLRRCAKLLGSELERFGFVVSIEDRDGGDDGPQPVLVATNGEAAAGHMLLIGHLDTVLPAVPPRRSGDRIVGTGALDMKAGFAAFVGALELRRRAGGATPPGLLLAAVPDEEIGGPISEAVVRELGAGARAVLVLEPGQATEDGETIVAGRRGLSVWRLEASGRAAHSGLAYDDGRSALAAAGEWCSKVQRLSENGGGPIVNVGRIVGGDSEFVRDLGEEHRFVGTSHRLNVVPDRCLAEGEIRYLRLSDRDALLTKMKSLAAAIGSEWGVAMRFDVVSEIPPVPPSVCGAELAESLVASAAAWGWVLGIENDRGGVSFPNFLPDPAAVPVIDGLGPVGAGMHTRDEYVSLLSLERRIHLIARLLELVE